MPFELICFYVLNYITNTFRNCDTQHDVPTNVVDKVDFIQDCFISSAISAFRMFRSCTSVQSIH